MLRTGIITLLLAGLMAATAGTAQAEATEYREGEHYQTLPIPVDTRDPSKIEVVEVFSYGCIHCKNFQPFVDGWRESVADDVDFYRLPATFSQQWEVLAQLYYAAEALGVTGQVHEPIFTAIHDRGVNLTDPGLMAELFEREAGVSADDFNKVFKSFSVRSRVQQAHARGMAYRLSGTPTVIVDGRYRVDGQMAGSNRGILEVVDHLVAERRQAKETASAEGGGR